MAADRAELIGTLLLACRQLRHHRHLDVAQMRPRPALQREAGEDPGAPFVMHQAARAIDRIEDALEAGAAQWQAARKGRAALVVALPFHDQLHGPVLRPVLLEPVPDRLLGNAVNPVDGVRRGHRRDIGKPLPAAHPGPHHRSADVVVQLAEQPTGPVPGGGVHQDSGSPARAARQLDSCLQGWSTHPTVGLPPKSPGGSFPALHLTDRPPICALHVPCHAPAV